MINIKTIKHQRTNCYADGLIRGFAGSPEVTFLEKGILDTDSYKAVREDSGREQPILKQIKQ